MKYYIVNDGYAGVGDYHSHILVHASNKKEALDRAWKTFGYDHQETEKECGYAPHRKKDFEVLSVAEWIKTYGYNDSVAVIH